MTENANKARLLIADDEAAQRQALCDTLEEQGYEVVGCSNGAAALSALREAPFDLLLADLMMPGMNGIELMRAAQAIDPLLVSIIMTGEGTIGTAVEAMQSGAVDYLLKPFRLSAALPVLTRALTLRHLRRENAELVRRLREHAAELEATNRELDAFTRSASHDLRAPLNVVLGFAALLEHTLGPQVAVEQRNWLLQIGRAAKQMNELIDALMRLSRAGKQALQQERVDVAAMVHDVAEVLRQEHTPARPVAVHVGELPTVLADPSLLRLALFNLLSNAFKYTRDVEQPTVDVRYERQGEGESAGWAFTVRDNGAGFDMAHANRLFHAFERLHRSDQFEGHGVGLSIVQRVIQRHGGRIWAQAAPGEGACFYFTLPGR